MSGWDGFLHGLSLAAQPDMLIYCVFGVLLGTFVGVLPGIGAMATISLLLPITYYLSPEAALVMLAGVYYCSQYGGAVASILLRLPGTPQSAVTTLDGYPLAQQGRAGVALFTSMISSFSGSMIGIFVLIVLSGALARAAIAFGAAEYAAMMILGLVAASTMGAKHPAKGLAMVVLGLILGCVGTDVNSGVQRFTFGQTALMDGVNLVALAMGLFGVAEVIANIRVAERTGVPPRPASRCARCCPAGSNCAGSPFQPCAAPVLAASSARFPVPAQRFRPFSPMPWSAGSLAIPSSSALARSKGSRGPRRPTMPPRSVPSCPRSPLVFRAIRSWR